MLAIGLGINPSKRDLLVTNPDAGDAFNTNSGPDPKVREAFQFCFPKNFKLYDIISLRSTNQKFNKLSKDEKIELCKNNEKILLSHIKEFNPDLLILFTVSNKLIIDFLNEFKDKYLSENIRIVKIKHPSYFFRWKGKEWDSKIFKKHLLERLKEEGIKLTDAGKIARL